MTPDTCDLWHIWPVGWGNMILPSKRQRQIQVQRERQWQKQQVVNNNDKPLKVATSKSNYREFDPGGIWSKWWGEGHLAL